MKGRKNERNEWISHTKPKVTHAVCAVDNVEQNLAELQQFKDVAFLVSEEYLSACIENEELLDHEEYELVR
jgi:hypothetical protein